MATIITYGTFDFFHYGHFELLSKAKNLGSKLIVGLSTDDFNQQKNKYSILSFEKRKKILESLNFVNLVIPEINWNQKINDIQKYNVDIFVMGDDWTGEFNYLEDYCQVIYLPRTDKISTSLIKELL
ncbi:glycerol-3-phosphate cytidylyltransferase [Ignatzschineria rhizosphaerae]|uniref:Glycerol-3-phosphate cytidylyltransferase n=1 Tax=Ignatzschineria rhizosphaerae TaxID=2923279 RepID=A0ABY3X1L2_9GAMM|nr:glycerol-3-phosphate cytidylyltransferase [Ignatzschineria rhizosphaerae]UNM96185.1 glycerol-3-phosphate cytidylyltransferase [Ignatzschineria rhizosphaerae]